MLPASHKRYDISPKQLKPQVDINSLCEKHSEVFPVFISSHHAITQDGAPFSEEALEDVEEN